MLIVGNGFSQKVEQAIERLKMFEPDEGYFVAFSGGKDSQCVYHLCEMAGVKFDAHYNVSSVDPPELVRFIREKYQSVNMEIPHNKDGRPITMWNLIPKHLIPPTRHVRYCCEHLKEKAGESRVTVTGVRWEESANRANNHDVVTFTKPTTKLKKTLEENNADFRQTGKGIVMNTDNDESRRMVEQCYRTNKTLMNPIIDWSEADVWRFLLDVANVESCGLYAEGFQRIGCIGCPLANGKQRAIELARWPKYKALYLNAFDRMLAERANKGKETDWQSAQDVFDWWIGIDVIPGQMRMDDFFGT